MTRKQGITAVLLAALTGCAGKGGTERSVWQPVPLTTDAELQDLWFADRRNGWVVGGAHDIEGGIIGRTRDGGRTWRFASGFVSRWPGVMTFRFTAVQFLDSLRGCTVGSGGEIFLTEDGGENWRVVRHGRGDGLRDLHFVDRHHGWAVGAGGVLRTTDGGEHWFWTVRSRWENGYLSGDAVHFLDRDTGWMTHHRSVMKTTDGGASWTALPLPLGVGENPRLFDIHFPDARRGWVVGENGTILATSDGGQSWIRQTHGIPAPPPRPPHVVRRANGLDTFDLEGPPPGLLLMAVRFLDARRGWTIGFFPTEGRSVVLRTDDGGATWVQEAEAAGEELRALFLSGEGEGWTVGDRVREGRQTLLRRPASRAVAPRGAGGRVI